MHDPLADIPLFKMLPPDERQELSSLLKERHFPPDQEVVRLGEPGDELFIVRSGRLTATCPDEQGRDVQLGDILPGHFFGEISLLDGGPRTATVRTHNDSELLTLGRSDLLEFLRGHPDAAIHMLTILGERQRNVLGKMRGIRNVNEAVAQAQTSWHRLAEKVASISASRAFVLFNLCGFSLWVIVNVVLSHLKHPPVRPWDEAPNFSVLSFLVTVEALFITLFVLISQGQQNERDRIRADLDYQINLKAHQEVMQLHHKIERVHRMLRGQHHGGHDAADHTVSASDAAALVQPGPTPSGGS